MRASTVRLAAAVLAAFGILAAFGPAIAPVEAGLSYPRMIWPSTGKITQPYGCTGFKYEPRRGDCKHFHLGIDVADSRATPIRAMANGVVTHVGLDPFMSGKYRSWTVVIRHGNGVRTFYAHLQKRDVPGARKGKKVVKGQKIGYMGNTGLSTGVHIHFAVIEDHRWVNPGRFLTTDAPKR
jgi:murein DD-endopeptidase MepM/ murein hydrolase activator NlpD